MSKYGNRKTTYDGHVFDSRAEALRYSELMIMERAGLITDLELQPEYELIPAHQRDGRKVRAMKYVADFRYIDEDGRVIVEDVKGVETPVFKLKKKMLEYRYPDVTITLIRV